MKYLINRPQGSLHANVTLPSSKSISNRLLVIRKMCNTSFTIDNLSDSDDTKVLIEAINNKKEVIDIGHAGTAMRFLTSYLAFTLGKRILTGSERMKNRPVRELVDALRRLGANIGYLEKEGYPPLSINGVKPTSNTVEIDGSISSQFISALLLMNPVFENGLHIQLKNNVISSSYITLTLKLMKEFGISSSWEGNIIKVDKSTYQPKAYTIEPDWSSASYWYEIQSLAACCDVFIRDLTRDSIQGDAAIAEIYANLGISTSFSPGGALVWKSSKATDKLPFNFINNPDMVQTLAVTCCFMNIPFIFSGCQSLRIKETDRIEALKIELAKFGFHLSYTADGILEWNGNREPYSEKVQTISTYKDHRMAMAFAPVCLQTGAVIIDDPQVVSKSYPGYWKDLENAGFIVSEIE
jgi:3-phosphoshikimate 1-carboxyvinyltransferase